MKRNILIAVACMIVLVIVIGAVIIDSQKPMTDNLLGIRQLFSQEQWRSTEFKSVMGISPGKKESYDDIVAACKNAGISDPILPQDDDHPDGSKYFCAISEQTLSETQRYQLRFRALADQKDFSKVYSIWIAAVPMEKTEAGFTTSDKEYIFSVNATPDDIAAFMAQY